MAYKYDPVLRMNVPDMTTDAKTWVVEYEDALGDNHKKTFIDKTAVEKFIRRGTDVGRAYHLKVNGKPVKNESTWTADERTVDKSGVHIVEYVDVDGDKQKQTIKGTAAEANKRIEELKQHGCKITKTRMFANWDHAIQSADASRIIEQKNGYTLGINSQGTICLAFPGETIDNPHMYLGKENEKNLADAKILFMEFAR